MLLTHSMLHYSWGISIHTSVPYRLSILMTSSDGVIGHAKETMDTFQLWLKLKIQWIRNQIDAWTAQCTSMWNLYYLGFPLHSDYNYLHFSTLPQSVIIWKWICTIQMKCASDTNSIISFYFMCIGNQVHRRPNRLRIWKWSEQFY